MCVSDPEDIVSPWQAGHGIPAPRERAGVGGLRGHSPGRVGRPSHPLRPGIVGQKMHDDRNVVRAPKCKELYGDGMHLFSLASRI